MGAEDAGFANRPWGENKNNMFGYRYSKVSRESWVSCKLRITIYRPFVIKYERFLW